MGLVVSVFVVYVNAVEAVCWLKCSERVYSVWGIWRHLEGSAVFETRLVVRFVTDS
jgi:hypothetical protein